MSRRRPARIIRNAAQAGEHRSALVFVTQRTKRFVQMHSSTVRAIPLELC
jgi:hypothetical protein